MIGALNTALIFMLCILLSSSIYAKEIEMSFNRDNAFYPMRISYSDLYQVISQTQLLLTTANKGYEETQRRNNIRIDSEGSTYKFEGNVLEGSFSQAPNNANYVYFEYQNNDAPITHIELRLSDFKNSLEVKGESREQVEALYRVISNKLEEIDGAIGGSKFRIMGGSTLLILGMLLSFLSTRITNRYAGISFSVIGPLLSISVWVFPWEAWFPGVVIFHGDASVLVRYAPEISFLGLILTLITFIFSTVYAYHISLKKAKNGETIQIQNK